MRRIWLALALGSLAAAGCGDDDYGHERPGQDLTVLVDLIGADLEVPPDFAVPPDLTVLDLAVTDGGGDGAPDGGTD